MHVGGSSPYDSVFDFLILFVFSEAFSFICRGSEGLAWALKSGLWTIPLGETSKRSSKGTASNCRYEPNAGC